MHPAKLLGFVGALENAKSVAGVKVRPEPVCVKMTEPVAGSGPSMSPLKNVARSGKLSIMSIVLTSTGPVPVLLAEIV